MARPSATRTSLDRARGSGGKQALGTGSRGVLTVSLVVLVALGDTGCTDSPEVVTLPVPDVRGSTVGAGAKQMQSLGLCVWIEQGTGADRGPVIVGQRPQAGVVVVEGTVVYLVTASVEDLSEELHDIGQRNRQMSCSEGIAQGSFAWRESKANKRHSASALAGSNGL